MMAILNSLNVHYLPIFQPILMVPASKLKIHRALSDKTYFFIRVDVPFNVIANLFIMGNYFNELR